VIQARLIRIEAVQHAVPHNLRRSKEDLLPKSNLRRNKVQVLKMKVLLEHLQGPRAEIYLKTPT
jgi:hypothetical protein